MNHNKLIISSVGQSIINSLNSGILILDKNGKVMLANRKAPELYCFSHINNFVGIHYKEILPEDFTEQISHSFESVLNGQIFRMEALELLDNDLKKFFLGATFYPLYNEWGAIVGIIINGQNITKIILESKEKKKLEDLNRKLNNLLNQFKFQNEQLNQSNIRNETIINTIFDSLSTPITILINSLDNIKSKTIPDKLQEDISMLTNVFKHLIDLKDQITKLNEIKNNSEEYQLFNINTILQKSIDDFHEIIQERKLQIVCELSRKDIQLRGIQEEINNAINHILENAIQYSHEQGKITITDKIWEGYYFITIKDQGIGIPAKDLPNVFTPFYRGSNAHNMAKGSGLNLTISKNIIEKYNGAINIESELDVGTTVTFYFKIVQ